MSLPTPPNEQMSASEAVTIKVASTAVESSVSMSQSRVSGTSANVKLELNESDVLAVSGGIDGHGLDASGRDEGIVDRSPGERYVRFAEKLGCGAYKDVYRAYDTIEGIEVAWNEVKLSGISKSDKVRIINEVQLLQKLNHKNIISFYGSWTNREKEQVIFVTEILSSGTLKSFIKKVQVIRWNVAKRWANEILDGLVYLHTQDPPVSHRDLKCDNIFINGTSGDLRIGDLGLSTAISKSKALSVLGTPEFMAPELYDEKYDEKVDIYAFGMCMLEIFTKEVPYLECSNPAQIYKKVTNQVEPQSLARVESQQARDFILHCIDTDPSKRPSALELKEHEFLKSNSETDDSEIVVLPREVSLPVIAENRDAKSLTSQMQSMSSDSDHVKSESKQSVPTRPNATDIRPHDITSGTSDVKSEAVGVGEISHASSKNIPTNTDAASEKNDVSKVPSENDTSQYIVAAECMDEVVVDNVMKLIISIPIQNETQHVQFEFHLVEDDPVQVAREMVTELQIPEQAILEISETISGLARDARVTQGKALREKKHSDDVEISSPMPDSSNAVQSSQSQGSLVSELTTQAQPARTVTLGDNIETIPNQPSFADSDSLIDIEEIVGEELRQLEADHKKSLDRANKAYDTRMDNLKRSKEEKLAQHRKLLEKHEKEMDDFEKRLKQAGVDHSKRLEKLDNEWNVQKKALIEEKRKEVMEDRSDVDGRNPSQAVNHVDSGSSSVNMILTSTSQVNAEDLQVYPS